MKIETPAVLAHSWLLLIHQLPAKPAYLRVKIWRRLQGIGAIAVKNAVHVLPMNEETQEDFEWLLREIEEGGGEAFVCEARLIDGLSDQEIRTLFDQTRDADYAQVAKDAHALAKSLRPNAKTSTRADVRAQVARLRKRLAEIVAIDFFGAIGRETAEGAIRTLEARLDEDADVKGKDKDTAQSAARPPEALRNRTWVTREGVYVDRVASAWLIRRFIDPEAQFKFVSGKGYRPKEGELRFDMFEAEFTHEGDKCTFEVLLDRCGLKDAALRAIGEIIHDIDLKDGKFGRTEVAGIRTLMEGIGAATKDDAQRIARGTEVFNDLYEYFRKKRR
jgi:hypothetical protein